MTNQMAPSRPRSIDYGTPPDEITQSNQEFLRNSLKWMLKETDFAAYIRNPGQKTKLPVDCIALSLGPCLKVPLFQFSNGWTMIPIVAQVNKILLADNRHWGAACWWLDGHAHTPLYVPPYKLIASHPQLLLDLAKQL